jgi:hypothetical protein
MSSLKEKYFDFLRPTNFKLSNQLKGKSINNCDVLKFIISVRGRELAPGDRKPSYAT